MQPSNEVHTDSSPETVSQGKPMRASGMGALAVEANFVRALIGMNLASAMEYRASFLTQIVFMFVNNGIYFLYWVLYFDRFGNVGGYVIHDIYLLFAVVAMGFGLGTLLAGNTGQRLAYLIAQGRLDYYLVLPRPVLLHVIFSHMTVASFGDVAFGLLALGFSGYYAPVELGFYVLAVVAVALIYTGYMTLAGSLSFFFGNAEYVSAQLNMALLTFSLYPHGLFSGGARLLLYTLLPASFMGSVPVALIQERSLGLLAGLWGVALVSCAAGAIVFAYGLRRYESGSALNVNV